MGKYGAWELIALVAAFFLTCFLGVMLGMLISVVISVLGFVYQSTQADVVELQREIGTLHYTAIRNEDERRQGDRNVKILKFQTALWFANCHRFTDAIKVETNFKKELPYACTTSKKRFRCTITPPCSFLLTRHLYHSFVKIVFLFLKTGKGLVLHMEGVRAMDVTAGQALEKTLTCTELIIYLVIISHN